MGVSRLIAIGDIHGHSNILRVILDSINPQPTDSFIFLGDLINRGPDSKGVIDQVIELNNICNVKTILGNHEEMLLGAFLGGKSDHAFWCKFGGGKTLQSYRADNVRQIPGSHMLFIKDCLDYYETNDFIFVHAGCNPDIPLSDNSGTTLRWNKLDQATFKPHRSGKTVVCGHTVQKQILDLGYICCIDTGCGIWAGGRLTAIDLLSGKVWQAGLKSKRATIKQRVEITF